MTERLAYTHTVLFGPPIFVPDSYQWRNAREILNCEVIKSPTQFQYLRDHKGDGVNFHIGEGLKLGFFPIQNIALCLVSYTGRILPGL